MQRIILLNYIIIGIIFFSFQERKKTILFYGDSITAGYGLDPQYAFPELVKKDLTNKGFSIEVINAGLSGETSAGGASRIDWVLRQPVDIFILELGGNDGLRGLPLDQTRKNLQSIINRVRKHNPNVKIVIAGMMVPPNLGEDYSKKFKNIFPELATKNNTELIPFILDGVAGDPKLNLNDGIHPNVEGHKIVAKTVLAKITKLL